MQASKARGLKLLSWNDSQSSLLSATVLPFEGRSRITDIAVSAKNGVDQTKTACLQGESVPWGKCTLTQKARWPLRLQRA